MPRYCEDRPKSEEYENPSPAETVKEQPEQSSIQKNDTVQTGQAIECNDRGQPEVNL